MAYAHVDELQSHGKPFYLGASLKSIDALLFKQCSPHEFNRPPRSIIKELRYWKASEYCMWLLYYALPLLSDFLPPLFLHHISLLVTAIHLLLKVDITDAQISSASSFCGLLPELYREDSSTANAHFLTHLPRYVRLWGPLCTHSAFGFKSMNGHLRNNIHSQTQVHKQLVFSVEVNQALQCLHAHLAENEEEKHLNMYPTVTIHHHAKPCVV